MNVMKTSWTRPRTASLFAALLFSLPLAAQAQAGQGGEGKTSFFGQIAGSWSGSGSVTMSEGTPEPIRCRAIYNPTSSSQLGLTLSCASASFNLQVRSDLALNGDRLAGTWTETSVGASGDVSGGVDGNRLRVTVSGTGVSAKLSLTLQGEAQSITLTSAGEVPANVSIVLRRS